MSVDKNSEGSVITFKSRKQLAIEQLCEECNQTIAEMQEVLTILDRGEEEMESIKKQWNAEDRKDEIRRNTARIAREAEYRREDEGE